MTVVGIRMMLMVVITAPMTRMQLLHQHQHQMVILKRKDRRILIALAEKKKTNKRGKKRKNQQQQQKDEEQQDTQQQDKQQQQESTQEQKQKKETATKTKPISTADYDKFVPSSSSSIPKKKRGRKSKLKILEDYPAEATTAGATGAAAKTTNSDDSRKRKSNKNVNSSSSSIIIVSAESSSSIKQEQQQEAGEKEIKKSAKKEQAENKVKENKTQRKRKSHKSKNLDDLENPIHIDDDQKNSKETKQKDTNVLASVSSSPPSPSKNLNINCEQNTSTKTKSAEKKKRGRPRKSRSPSPLPPPQTSLHSSAEKSKKITNTVNVASNASAFKSPLRKKRKTDYVTDDRKLHPRLLLVTNRSDLDKDEDSSIESNKTAKNKNDSSEKLNKNEIKCGLCKEITTRKSWVKHLSEHYGVGWIDGEEEPINVESFREVQQLATKFFKKYKIKCLKCHLCGIEMKSGLGLIGHLENCGLSKEEKQKQLVKCDYCQGLYTHLTLPIHMKSTCNALHSNDSDDDNASSAISKTAKNQQDVVYSNTGRRKRKSVIIAEKKFAEAHDDETKAEDKYVLSYKPIVGRTLFWKFRLQIKNRAIAKCIGKECTFRSTDIDELMAHNDECAKVPRGGYTCIECNYHDMEKSGVIEHYMKNHRKEQLHKIRGNESSDASLGSESSSEEENEDEEEEIDYGSDDDSDEILKDEKRTRKKKKKKMRLQEKSETVTEYSKWNNLIYWEGHGEGQRLCWKRTLQFQNLNFSKIPLYTFSLPPATMMTPSTKTQNPLITYFPKNRYSMKFLVNTSSSLNSSFGSSSSSNRQQQSCSSAEWQQLERFHVKHINDEKFIFMGGSITCLTWIPLPSSSSSTSSNKDDKDDKEEQQHQEKCTSFTSASTTSQYLVISCKNDIYKFVKCIDPQPMPTIILIYEFESYNAKTTNVNETSSSFKSDKCLPKLLYGIPFDTGPIHTCEFLPSGGYSLELNRLGLMAVASACADVKIFSLPIKAPINCDNLNDIDLLTNLKPVIQLKLDIRRIPRHQNTITSTPTPKTTTIINSKFYKEAQCTLICWSKAKGHKYIGGAYSNGFVAIWNMDDDKTHDNLNKYVIGGITNHIPVCYFHATVDMITGLDFHYDMNGLRWLLVSTKWKDIIIYDIKDLSCPQILTQSNQQISINKAMWPLIWENPIFVGSSKELNQCGLLNSISPLGIHYSTAKIYYTASNISDVTYNHWNNICATGSTNGDFIIYLSTVLNLNLNSKLTNLNCKWLSYTDLIRVDGKELNDNDDLNTNDFVLFDPNYLEKYGLVIGKLTKVSNELESINQKRNCPFWLNTFVKINKITSNQNKNGNKLYALGYENGIVRITEF